MIGGFGSVAHPAEYANSAIMTLMVNHQTVLCTNHLGPKTVALEQRNRSIVT
jgi:hypothetical protein